MTENATQLLDRFDRVRAAVTASAKVPETVLQGSVATVTGELAEVETALGTVRGRHDGVREGDSTQVRIGADAITVLDPGADPEPNATSARNRFSGRVADVDRGETVHVVAIDVDGISVRALVTDESTARMDLRVGRDVAITWKATATRLVPASRS